VAYLGFHKGASNSSLLLRPSSPPCPLPTSHSRPIVRIIKTRRRPLPPLPLETGPLNPARGLGKCWNIPSGVWGRAPAEIYFGAF